MDPTRTKVIACATVIEELQPLLPAGMETVVLDFGLHLTPGKLKQSLQEAIDASCFSFDTLLLGYGLCSMAAVGLEARGCTLVVPKVDDCITLFLGSRRAYSDQARQTPGTYYLTKGWIEVADTPFAEHERLVAKYGQEKADYVMKLMLKHYTRLVYIDTGQADQDRHIAYARQTAEQFNLRFEQVQGEDTLLRKMVSGAWDQDFVVAPPGHVINYLDFKDDSAAPA